jgi:hypothetical protein
VADAARPRLLSSMVFGARGSLTALDSSPHGLNVMRDTGTGRLRLALPVSARAQDFSSEAEHGLFRFEADTRARSLTQKPTLRATDALNTWDLSQERSVQIGPAVYYFSQGRWYGMVW